MPGVFASLVLEKQIPTVVKGIQAAVNASFAAEKHVGRIILVSGAADRAPSHAELQRRTAICFKIFRELRGDLQWAVPRIVDHLPKYLRNVLDGVAWEPSARSSWVANQ